MSLLIVDGVENCYLQKQRREKSQEYYGEELDVERFVKEKIAINKTEDVDKRAEY